MILLDTHMMIAGIFHAPRWAITDDEATRVAETFARVARWYNIPEVPERIADHYGFLMALAMVYGTRIMTEWNEANKKTVTVKPVPTQASTHGAGPQASTNGAAPQGSGVHEPPDPRDWRKVQVDGVGEVDIPPVTGSGPH
jgi:hypothetical protein